MDTDEEGVRREMERNVDELHDMRKKKRRKNREEKKATHSETGIFHFRDRGHFYCSSSQPP